MESVNEYSEFLIRGSFFGVCSRAGEIERLAATSAAGANGVNSRPAAAKAKTTKRSPLPVGDSRQSTPSESTDSVLEQPIQGHHGRHNEQETSKVEGISRHSTKMAANAALMSLEDDHFLSD
jgi:hypothetical protein